MVARGLLPRSWQVALGSLFQSHFACICSFGTSPVILMSCFEQNASIALFALASERKPCTFPCANVMECLPFRIGETEGAHPHLNRMPADEPDD